MSLQFWCALLLVLPLFLFIYLSQLPLSIATIIYFTNPLFVCLLAPIWLGERVTWVLGTAVTVGFVGAALVLAPSSSAFEWICRPWWSLCYPRSVNDSASRWRVRRPSQLFSFERCGDSDRRAPILSAGL